jgi:hypothetical protein
MFPSPPHESQSFGQPSETERPLLPPKLLSTVVCRWVVNSPSGIARRTNLCRKVFMTQYLVSKLQNHPASQSDLKSKKKMRRNERSSDGHGPEPRCQCRHCQWHLDAEMQPMEITQHRAASSHMDGGQYQNVVTGPNIANKLQQFLIGGNIA